MIETKVIRKKNNRNTYKHSDSVMSNQYETIKVNFFFCALTSQMFIIVNNHGKSLNIAFVNIRGDIV